MAFGDALRATDGATVVLNVDTSQTAKLEQAEAQWRESVGTMSREALKLDLAQDRLAKSLTKYGAESVQAKRATIALKDAEEQAARAADKQTRETRELTSAQSRQRAGIGGLTKGVVGLAGAYIGVYGLVSGVRASIEAAKEEQNVLGQTQIAVAAAGIEWERYEGRIQAVIRAQSQLGFDDEALMRTFQMFVRSTRDVNKALELNALAADVARGRYIDLEQAAMIVNKANLGMSGALRRIGLDVDKNATRVELLAALTRNYGQAAEAASDDAVAATDRLSVEWENMQEVVGRGLLPVVSQLADRLSDYFGDAENQAKVQRKVNAALETGEDVVRGFAGALKVIRTVTKPVVDLLGGMESTVKLLVLAFAVGKVLAFASAIRLIGTNARFASAQMGILAATSRGVGGGGVAPVLGVNPVSAVLMAAGVAGFAGWQSGHKDAIDSGEMAKLVAAARSGRIDWPELRALRPVLTDAQYRTLSGIVAIRNAQGIPDREGRGPRVGDPGTSAAGGGGGRRGGGGGGGGPSESDLLLDVARPGNERADLEALRGFYARRIRALEARKRLSEAQKEELRRLYGDIANVQSQIDAIEEEADRKAEDRERKRRERAEKRAKQEAAGREDLQKLNQESAERRKRFNARVQKLLADSGKEARRAKEKERAVTEAEIRQMHFEFLSGLQGVNNQFGSNYTDTQLWTQTELMRENNRVMRRLASATAHPGAKYARNELAMTLGGVGAI